MELTAPRLALPTPERSIFSDSGTQWAPVSGRITDRFLVTYRAPAVALARLVPAPFTVDSLGGEGFLSVCAVEILDMGLYRVPRPLRFDNREFLYRIGVRLGDEPTFITLRSDVSSRWLAFLGRHFSHYRPLRAEVGMSRARDSIRMCCQSRDGRGDALLDVDLTARDALSSSRFASAEAAAEFLLGMKFSADERRGRVQIQPIDHDPWQPSFVEVRAARFAFIEELGAHIGARFSYDSTLKSSGIRQIWRAARWL